MRFTNYYLGGEIEEHQHVTHMREMRNAYKILVIKPEGKTPCRSSRSKGKNNIMMNLIEVGWEGVDMIRMAQDSDQWRGLLNTAMNLRLT